MERTKILNILKEQGYPAFMLDKTADKVEGFHPIVAEAFEMWSEHEVMPSVSVEGYTYSILVEKFKMKPVGAFITLDWIMREPEVAVKNLREGIK